MNPDAALPATALPAVPVPPPHDLTMLGLFLQADIVVKAVMLLLILASIACWAIMVEKTITLGRLRRQVRSFARIVHDGLPTGTPVQQDGLAGETLQAGLREWREGREEDESRAEFRDRMERSMRGMLTKALRGAEPGLPILATTGSVAPFVGLFGTVWGIMNSFQGIAATKNTTLAVVAPGIAEALFTTALGLIAAIPALVAYNTLSGSIDSYANRLSSFAEEFAVVLSRELDAAKVT